MLHPADRTSCYSFQSAFSVTSVNKGGTGSHVSRSEQQMKFSKNSVKGSVFQCFIQNNCSQTNSPVLFPMNKSPHKTSSLLVHSSRARWSKSRCSSQVAGTIASVFTSFSLTWGMFSRCKETSEVSPEEGQVEGLSYHFTVLLVRSQLSTLRAEISRWHLLHFLLLCLKHPVFVRGQQIKRKYRWQYNVVN